MVLATARLIVLSAHLSAQLLQRGGNNESAYLARLLRRRNERFGGKVFPHEHERRHERSIICSCLCGCTIIRCNMLCCRVLLCGCPTFSYSSVGEISCCRRSLTVEVWFHTDAPSLLTCASACLWAVNSPRHLPLAPFLLGPAGMP